MLHNNSEIIILNLTDVSVSMHLLKLIQIIDFDTRQTYLVHIDKYWLYFVFFFKSKAFYYFFCQNVVPI